MPRVFDNIELKLLPTLQATLAQAHRADFCIGYFNLRGWRELADLVDRWPGGEGHFARVLVGMQVGPEQELRELLRLSRDTGMDLGKAAELAARMAEQFREQLIYGTPNARDEDALRCLSRQLKQGKVVVKLHLKYPLHAKLYLLYRDDYNNPVTGFLGSSNLTMAGLSEQGELNLDVLDHDATTKLEQWFNARWQERWCLDISAALAEVIDNSWAREKLLSPYHIYLKMAYHLSQEARAGLTEFDIPHAFKKKLFAFQAAAVQLAAHHVNRRGGVMIGDVVGLGKTLMATAVARIFEDDYGSSVLILCPPNLVSMWQGYVKEYKLRADVLPISQVTKQLDRSAPHYDLLVIDESHNLRNPEGKRYKAIRDYVARVRSKVVLLTATPYNKDYRDLAAQLALFVERDKDLGIRPERLLSVEGVAAFHQKHDALISSLAAFEQSDYIEDWRELMRLYLVRRTRSFIQRNYAEVDEHGRRYLRLADGDHSYFPTRIPKRAPFPIDEADPNDPYARLYSATVVDKIARLRLPRYGLGGYVKPNASVKLGSDEETLLHGLFRAGERLMGFTITNLFKRLESSGAAFIQSVERHILRNCVFLHALEHDLPLPIGTQSAALLDPEGEQDEDYIFGGEDDEGVSDKPEAVNPAMHSEADFAAAAAAVYARYRTKGNIGKFKWLQPDLFTDKLRRALRQDNKALLEVLSQSGNWRPELDRKLEGLAELLMQRHADEKVLVFTQFADTAKYLGEQLRRRGLRHFAVVTGDSDDPTALAWRFSPRSNEKDVPADQELRVLIATDVLSEGQNLQDAAIIVNYDLPWAIIRLIQRAGRVDRIGQKSAVILCYSFLPAAGVERIINLRGRLRNRLRENAEVVGADERFFDDEDDAKVLELYHEKAGVLDDDDDDEVDLASYAYQIWQSASQHDRNLVAKLPPVVYATKTYRPSLRGPRGVLVYCRTTEGSDALAWVDENGEIARQSQFDILQAAACGPDEPALPRSPEHHQLVAAGVERIMEESGNNTHEGRLGPRNSARRRAYQRLSNYAAHERGKLFYRLETDRVIQYLYEYPLQEKAIETLNRHLRDISDERLAELTINLYNEGRLSNVTDHTDQQEAQVICSLGLFD